MHTRKITTCLAIALFFSSCSQPIEKTETPTSAATALATPTLEQELGVRLELPTPIPGTVVLDLAARPCSASWSNNGEYLPCPGSQDAITEGYVNRVETTVIDGNIHIDLPSLLTIPAQAESKFQALFGKYPPFTVLDGDRFRAVLACENDHPACDADLSLAYYDANGQLIQIPGAKWNVTASGEGNYVYADTDLSFLAGRTVQFSLNVRDNGGADDDFMVWVQPHIARTGSAATDAIPPNQLSINIIDAVPVSGTVDMRSAPPYLYDDHPPGSPAVVVFFDVDSAMWYSTETTAENPDFTIEVMPGEYYLLAYSYGVGDNPYVEGAYTGIDPSCGKPMAVLQVLADAPLEDVTINDWNWSCSGSTKRLAKPEEVPLPQRE